MRRLRSLCLCLCLSLSLSLSISVRAFDLDDIFWVDNLWDRWKANRSINLLSTVHSETNKCKLRKNEQ